MFRPKAINMIKISLFQFVISLYSTRKTQNQIQNMCKGNLKCKKERDLYGIEGQTRQNKFLADTIVHQQIYLTKLNFNFIGIL